MKLDSCRACVPLRWDNNCVWNLSFDSQMNVAVQVLFHRCCSWIFSCISLFSLLVPRDKRSFPTFQEVPSKKVSKIRLWLKQRNLQNPKPRPERGGQAKIDWSYWDTAPIIGLVLLAEMMQKFKSLTSRQKTGSGQ